MKKLKLLSCTLLLALVACGGAATTNSTNPTSSEAPTTSSEAPSSEAPEVSSEASSSENPGTSFEDQFKDAYTPVEFDTTKDVTIKFYSTMGQNLQSIYNVYKEDFLDMYPNITIEESYPGGYDDVLDTIKTELSVGQGPDIAYCYADHVATYNKTKKVVKLDKLIADPTYGFTAAEQESFIEGYYNEGRQFGDGYMYTLPFSKSTEVLYYNKEFFQEHNLKVPTTWDEMEEVCRKIKTIDPNSIPLGYDSEANLFITMCEQLGSPYTSAVGDENGNHFLFNNDTNKTFTKRLRNWYQEGLLTTQEIYGSYTSSLFTETRAGYQKCYMCIGSSAGASNQYPKKDDAGKYPFTTGIAPIPQYNTENQKVISQGPSLCIFNQKDPQKVMASWLFMKFLTSNVGFQAEFSIKSGYVPVIKTVDEIKAYQDHVKNAENGNDYISALSTKVCLEQADNYFTSDAFLGSSDARVQVGTMLQACLTYSGDDVDGYFDTIFANAVYQCNYAIGNI